MKNDCRKCGKRLKDDDRIRVVVISTYHELPSKVYFAIGKDIEDADASTLEHLNCTEGD